MPDSQLIALQGEVSSFAFAENDPNELPGYLGGCLALQSLSQAKGDRTPIFCKNPSVPNRYDIIGYQYGASALGETSIIEQLPRNVATYVEELFNRDCPNVLLNKIGLCGRPDDLSVFESILAVEGMTSTNIEFSELGSLEGESNKITVTGNANFVRFGRFFPVKLGEKADTTVVAEVLDLIYADAVSCGDCGVASDGCDKIYAITRANTGSPGLSGQLVYTLDGWATNTGVDIQPLGGKDPSRITAVGNYLVVISEADGSLVYTLKSSISSTSWTRVTSGFVVGASPRAIYAPATNRVFMCGQGGYIYLSTNITAGVSVSQDNSLTTQRGNDIHGIGQTVVSVHHSNAIQVSQNLGQSWSLVTGPAVGVNLTCVAVQSSQVWYVGTGNGKLYYTKDAGTTWTQRLLPNQSNLVVVNRIKFAPDSPLHGVIAVEDNARGYLYRSFTAGREWYNNEPAITVSSATPRRFNGVALCGYNDINAGGLEQGSSDGVIVAGE